MTAQRRPVIYGATGFTGRIVAEALARRGRPFVVAGRDPARLEALAARLAPRPEVLVAPVEDRAALRALAARASVLCSTVGPFVDRGAPVVEACLEAGAHYLDTSGEQGWLRRVHVEYDAPAKAAGVVLCPAMAFEVAPGDVAARLAARDLDPVLKVSVIYAVKNFGMSRGTRASGVAILKSGTWQHVDGRAVPEAPGTLRHPVELPRLGRRTAMSYPSAEVFTIPRHVAAAEVRTWMVLAPWVAALTGSLAPALARLARGPVGTAVQQALERLGRHPDEAQRRKSRAAIYAVAHGRRGDTRLARTVSVFLEDPYALTGEVMRMGLQALEESPPPPGARAPAEVLTDGRAFLEAIGATVQEGEGDVGV